jgi:hypothetical protein
MTNKEQKQDKNDQVEAMEIVEDEESKQQRLVKETITGTLTIILSLFVYKACFYCIHILIRYRL